jgi:hypothetical protein
MLFPCHSLACRTPSKVGQFDGYVSNAYAFADPSMEDTVYAA